MQKIYREVKRWISERLFEYELEEDYMMGTKHGYEVSLASSILRLKMARNQDVKKNNPGLDKAIELLKELQK